MTAPVAEVIAAPSEAQGPTDTTPPVTETSEPQTMAGVIDTIANRAVPQDEPVAEPVADGAADTQGAVGGEQAAAPAEGAEDDNGLVTLIQFDEPDGQIDLRSRDPATGQFREMDSSQSFEFSMKDKQTGETRSYNKTLPELVQLARDGIAMQRHRGELNNLRDAVPQMQTMLQQRDTELQSLRALAESLLTGTPEYVNSQRNQYAAEMTPEKQYQRRLAELNQREAAIKAQQTNAQQQVVGQQSRAIAAAIAPTIEQVEGLVGKEMATGKFISDTAHLMVNGQYPPQNFAALQQYAQGPFVQWAQGIAAQRTQATEAATKAQADRKAAQAAVRAAGAATRPSTVASGAASATPVAKTPVGMEAVINSIISKPIPQVA